MNTDKPKRGRRSKKEILAAAANQNQVKEAILYSYNVNGLIPLYKGRHRLDGITMYTAMIDTRIHFTPVAPN